MTSNTTKFRLLYLPRLALESVLSNFDHLERFELSTCSKRCKRIVKLLKHGCTEIDVKLNRRFTSVTVSSGSMFKEYTWFHLLNKPGHDKHQFITLNGRIVRMKKDNRRIVFFYCSGRLTVDTKALVDHLMDTFRVSIKTLTFEMDYFYRHFVQCFPKCENLRISGVWPISEEEITYLKEHVEHNHFYINGNSQ